MIEWARERVLVTGGSGFLGSRVVRAVRDRGAHALVAPTCREFDLREARDAARLVTLARPTIALHCAGLSGGLGFVRSNPAAVFRDNLAMGVHLLEALRAGGAIDSGCRVAIVGHMTCYPTDAPQPLAETSLFGGPCDPATAPLGVAKLALLTMMRAYRVQYGLRGVFPIPTSLYGPGDTADPARSHAAGAMLARMHDAAGRGEQTVTCWGTGAPVRDFLFIDDAAEGLLRAVEGVDDCSPVNLAGPRGVSIRELADASAAAAGFRGSIRWDPSKPDGVPRRVLDGGLARARLGWTPRVDIAEGCRLALANL
ncbi:MAG TPA: NAD-dependent epimerase/dehydratase family protein [Phycisphaerales bacterium]|nr:NAD-dependent epimerase/dehydratase family protein [Phycisphaerales bacterium]